jgi:catalase
LSPTTRIRWRPGPTLLENFILREKITHFDHERMPERVVHARGSGAHGYFDLTQSLAEYSKAGLLRRAGDKTLVFVRFSTVDGVTGRDVPVSAVRCRGDPAIPSRRAGSRRQMDCPP